jgi:cytochrome c nitrite reductase small subunit
MVQKVLKGSAGVAAVGIFIGLVIAAIVAGSYHLAGTPQFCASCHSMETVHSGWQQSKHKQFACIDCHLPDSNLAHQVGYKAAVGMRDLYYETLRSYPDAIKLTAGGQEIVDGNCLRCHFSTVEKTNMASGGASCVKCHRHLVHGQRLTKGGINVE